MPPEARALAHSTSGLSFPEVTTVICRVPQPSFSRSPWYLLPVHQCRFAVRINSGHGRQRVLRLPPRGFSWELNAVGFSLTNRRIPHSSLYPVPDGTGRAIRRIYLSDLAYCLDGQPYSRPTYQTPSPHWCNPESSVGILTYCPSATAFALTLGPTNPTLTNVA